MQLLSLINVLRARIDNDLLTDTTRYPADEKVKSWL